MLFVKALYPFLYRNSSFSSLFLFAYLLYLSSFAHFFLAFPHLNFSIFFLYFNYNSRPKISICILRFNIYSVHDRIYRLSCNFCLVWRNIYDFSRCWSPDSCCYGSTSSSEDL